MKRDSNRPLNTPDYYRSINITEVIRASFWQTIDKNRTQFFWIFVALLPLIFRSYIIELFPSLAAFTYDLHSSITLLVVLICGAQILNSEWDRLALNLHVDGYFLKVSSGWLTVNRACVPLNNFMMIEVYQTKPQMALGFHTVRIIALNNPELEAFQFPWLRQSKAHDFKHYLTWNINRLATINSKPRKIDKKIIDTIKEDSASSLEQKT